jgi:hypothetical protein
MRKGKTVFPKKNTHGPDLGRSRPACWVPARFARSAREGRSQTGLPGGAQPSGLFLYPKGYDTVRSRSNGPDPIGQKSVVRTEEDGGAHLRVAGVLTGIRWGARPDAQMAPGDSGGHRKSPDATRTSWGRPEVASHRGPETSGQRRRRTRGSRGSLPRLRAS